MADGLKFSLTVLFPDTHMNMISIRRILTSFPGSRVFAMENGTAELVIQDTIPPENMKSFMQGLRELTDSLGVLYIDEATAEFFARNAPKAITGEVNLILQFVPD
jgi:hypothetical protein